MDLEPSFNFLQTIDSDMLILSMAIVVLLYCSAMISAAEVAFFSLTEKDINELSLENPRKAELISNLIQKPKKLLATLLVANNFINIGVVIIFSILGNSLFSSIHSPLIKFVVEVIVITFLILLFGEVLPKVYASRNKVNFSVSLAAPLFFLDKLLSPISIPMRSVTVYLHDKIRESKNKLICKSIITSVRVDL